LTEIVDVQRQNMVIFLADIPKIKITMKLRNSFPPPSPLVTLCVIYAARRGMIDLIDA
jgi:hypothetical protein